MNVILRHIKHTQVYVASTACKTFLLDMVVLAVLLTCKFRVKKLLFSHQIGLISFREHEFLSLFMDPKYTISFPPVHVHTRVTLYYQYNFNYKKATL